MRRFDSDNTASLLQRAINLYSVYAPLGEMPTANETLITRLAIREDIRIVMNRYCRTPIRRVRYCTNI